MPHLLQRRYEHCSRTDRAQQWIADFNATLEPGRRIVLTPKEAALADIIQRIVLQLSDMPGLLDSVTVHESDESYTRFRFQDAVLNGPLDDAVFSQVE